MGFLQLDHLRETEDKNIDIMKEIDGSLPQLQLIYIISPYSSLMTAWVKTLINYLHFMGGKSFLKYFSFYKGWRGLNVPVDYTVLSFASKISEEKLGVSAALWGSQECWLLFKNAYSVFSWYRSLVLHFIGLSVFLYYTF